ncbi:MAG: vWA domain-containing protein [Patescibacteria group bacterium]
METVKAKEFGIAGVLLIFGVLLLLVGGGVWFLKFGPGKIVTEGPLTGILNPASLDKYDLDSDGDGIPNFVELALGFDPYKNDCALSAGCSLESPNKPQGKTNILFIEDSSGSMAGKAGAETKIEAAKTALKKYIDNLSAEIKAGLMVYGHKGSNSAADKAVSCAGIDLLYPIGMVDKASFKSQVETFKPTGWTPIADSFKKAQSSFAGYESDNNKIILVSDGIETCGGDPCKVAAELKQSGISPMIDVVGFDVDSKAKQQLSCIAQVTGGTYYDAKTSQEFYNALDTISGKTSDWAKNQGCLNANTASYQSCLNDHYSKAANYLYDLLSKATGRGDAAEVGKINEVLGRMFKRWAELSEVGLKNWTGTSGNWYQDWSKTIQGIPGQPGGLSIPTVPQIQIPEFKFP